MTKELIEELTKINWPVLYHNRLKSEGILGPYGADIGVVWYWTAQDKILASHGAQGTVLNENSERIAVASPLYSAFTGLNYMLANIASNPFISTVIGFGTELKDPRSNTGNVLRAFFKKGVDDKGRIVGNENYKIDSGIPADLANLIAKNVSFVDVNSNNWSLADRIDIVNSLLNDLPRKNPSRNIMRVELSKPKSRIMPYEGGPIVVRGRYVGEVWLDLVDKIMRYGSLSLMEQVPKGQEGRQVREVNSIVAVIDGEDPDSPNLKKFPFLPLSPESIQAYISEQMLSPTAPEELKYAYGKKMRSYKVATDWPLRQEEGFSVDGKLRQVLVDQVSEAIDVFNKGTRHEKKPDLFSKNAVIITWQPDIELLAKRNSSPCLVYVHPIVKDGRLNMNVVFRSHDMFEGWPMNAFGCLGLQKYMAERIYNEEKNPLKPGVLTIISDSAQIYAKNWVAAEELLEKCYHPVESVHDPRGDYRFEIMTKGKVLVAHSAPDGTPLEEFIDTPKKLEYILGRHGPVNPVHLQYIGRELAKIQVAIDNNVPEAYMQDKPLDIRSAIEKQLRKDDELFFD